MFPDVEDHSLETAPEDARTVGYLRAEAYAVRDCFTRYSLQILAVTGAILVAIARFQGEMSLIGLMAIFPILLLFHVLIMGVHKYGTSNRLLGYELHLQRTAHYSKRDRCHELFKTVGWEEAMRAWRIIQPSLWNCIYEPSTPTGDHAGIPGSGTSNPKRSHERVRKAISKFMQLFYRWEKWILENWISIVVDPDWLKLWVYPLNIKQGITKQIESESLKGPESYFGYWFDQSKALERYRTDGIIYNAGGYLRTFSIIFLMALAMCLAVIGIAILQLWYFSFIADGYRLVGGFVLSVLLSIIFPFLATLVFVVWRNIRGRIQILEHGLQSIHSTAIIWEAIILAHLLTLSNLRFYDKGYEQKITMHGYTNSMALQAKQILDYVPNIHEWIDIARVELDKTIRQQADAESASQTLESGLVPQSP